LAGRDRYVPGFDHGGDLVGSGGVGGDQRRLGTRPIVAGGEQVEDAAVVGIELGGLGRHR